MHQADVAAMLIDCVSPQSSHGEAHAPAVLRRHIRRLLGNVVCRNWRPIGSAVSISHWVPMALNLNMLGLWMLAAVIEIPVATGGSGSLADVSTSI
jgi:hypothetical protein